MNDVAHRHYCLTRHRAIKKGSGAGKIPRPERFGEIGKMADDKRKKLIQLVHVGKGKLGWDGAAYRAFLSGVCGKESAAEMTERELKSALSAMRRLGFAEIPRRVKPLEKGRATLAQLEYIKGMWAVCARDKSDRAMLAFVNRVAHVRSLRFLDEHTARGVILALRDIMEKAGFDPDTSEKLHG